MANARALDKRRKSIRNIRKITRTMELIATARFKKAMDRATAASAYTERITKLVGDLASGGLELNHPLMEARDTTDRAVLLVLTSNRGLCGGFNGNVVRAAMKRWRDLGEAAENPELEVSGKRGISAFRYRGIPVAESFTHFEDKPRFDEVDVLASRYLQEFAAGKLDRFDVVYTRFETAARQRAMVETLLPLQTIQSEDETEIEETAGPAEAMYEFEPSAQSILQEVVPSSFKVKLFKCFLDSAVSEQISRMVAMKGATENAGDLIRRLSMNYNRARQSQITGEIMEIIGGVEALSG